MGYWDEKHIQDEKPKRTAFEEFVVNFVVAFSGCTLLILKDLI
jgi:hypothetical protein